VIQQDEEKDLVKVRYTGYSSDHNEWQNKADIIHLDEADDCSEEEDNAEGSIVHPLCLYDELAFRIKTALSSNRKGDPVCSISMTFDSIYFEGLARRGSNVASSSKVKMQYYTMKVLSNLDDVLGRRWYIRDLNTVGDFCYAIPGSVKFHLKYCKTKTDGDSSEARTTAGYACA